MTGLDQSILDDVKKTLGLTPDYTVFDQELVIHINTALFVLTQLGLGPVDGFTIDDASATWSDFIGTNKAFSPAKSYVYLRVRMLFDPPSVGYVLTSQERMLDEYTWRISVQRELTDHPTPPTPTPVDCDDIFADQP